MYSQVPFEDCNFLIKHDTGLQEWGATLAPHTLQRVGRFTAMCGDISLLVECSCGQKFTAVVSNGGCGGDHYFPDTPHIDTFHASLLLIDGSRKVDVDREAVERSVYLLS